MISTKYWFNKGIYQNIVNRFKWGSILYIVMLFFSGPFVFMMRGAENSLKVYSHISSDGLPVILSNSFLLFPLLVAMIVPTVVAYLVFSGVHNSRHGIFLHSLPTTRKTNYLSQLCASFTLMFAPVVLIGIVYAIMSVCGYSKIISISDIISWIAINIFVLFIMFSIAAFSAYITGNGIASVVVNACIHLLPLIISLAIINISVEFIYGFNENSNIANDIAFYTPIVWIFKNIIIAEKHIQLSKMPQVYIYILGAILIYAITYMLYKKRKIELCGDVAAFKIFKPILKYGITLFTAIAVGSAVLSIPLMNGISKIAVMTVLSACIYFASEMLITKNVHVLKSYKGFIGFFSTLFAIISFFAFTSVFGYETYIPDIDKISEASVSDMGTWYYENLTDKDLITDTRNIHKMLTNDIPDFIGEDDENDSIIYINYKMKNGKKISRKYYINSDDINNIMNTMFKSKDYKLKYCGLDNLNIQNIKNVDLEINSNSNVFSLALNDDTKGFFDALIKDAEKLSYSDFYTYTPISFSIHIHKTNEENKEEKIFKNNDSDQYLYFDITVNGNFSNTINYLKEKGYYNQAYSLLFKKGIYMGKSPTANESDKQLEISPAELIDENDKLNLFNDFAFRSFDYEKNEKSYYIYTKDAYDDKIFENYILKIPEKELPDYMKKYTSQN